MTAEQGWLGLVAAIIKRTPRLSGALCTGRPEVFDCRDGNGVETAVALCRRCPALSACRAWTQTRSRRELVGVVAGIYFPTKSIKDEGTQHDNT